MAKTEVIIQSLHSSGVDFRIKNEDGTITTKSLNDARSGKNILVLTAEEYKKIEDSPTLKSLLYTKKARILDSVPASFKGDSVKYAEARQAVKDAKAETQSKQKELDDHKAKIADLEKQIADLGGKAEKK